MSQFSVNQAFLVAVEHHQAGRLMLARSLYRQVIAQQPDHADALHFLGVIANQLGQNDLAVNLIEKSIALKSNSAEAHSNLGIALRDSGRLDEAIAAYRRALSLRSDYPEAHHNLGLVLLLRGDLGRGWKEFEWRWRCGQFWSSCRTFDQPQWDGSDLSNHTIFLRSEQGYGDTIQFVRYVPLVAARGGRVLFGCDPELRRLLQTTVGVAEWVEPDASVPKFDTHCALLSLPVALGTTLESIPQAVPYIKADSEEVERWRKELLDDGDRFRVGLAWAGQPNHQNDRNRSLSPNALEPLAHVQGVRFYSLQKGAAGKQAASAPPSMELIDRTGDLNDFADTAALIANLDLVISVDTAVAHLAGAMGKPVWVMLPFMPDWRWLMGRDDSPWYPTMRLFRQPSPGDWGNVIDRAAESLSARVTDGRVG